MKSKSLYVYDKQSMHVMIRKSISIVYDKQGHISLW